MRKKCIYFLFILIFFAFIFFKLQKSHVNYNIDEVSWFFHTAFFDELFLKTNFDKNLWLSFESFDHPQLSKYIFGAYLFSKDKEYGYERDKLQAQYGRWDFYGIIGVSDSKAILNSPFSDHLNKMREVNLVTAFLSLVVLFLLCKILTQNTIISLLFCYSLAGNSLFIYSMKIATPDSHYIFFLLLALFSYMQYISTKRKLYLYLFGLFSGFSVAAKLTGAVMLIVYILYLTYRLFIKNKHKLAILLKEFLIVGSIVAIVWTITNPAIFYSPISSSIFYFSSRIEKLNSFSHLFPDVGLTSIQDRIYSAYCISLSRNCHGYSKDFDGQLFTSPFLNIPLALFGILYVIQLMKDRRKSEAIFLTILLIIVIIGTAVLVPLKWNRYYLPLTIFLMFLEFMGISYVVNFVIKRYGLKIKQLLSLKIQ